MTYQTVSPIWRLHRPLQFYLRPSCTVTSIAPTLRVNGQRRGMVSTCMSRVVRLPRVANPSRAWSWRRGRRMTRVSNIRFFPFLLCRWSSYVPPPHDATVTLSSPNALHQTAESVEDGRTGQVPTPGHRSCRVSIPGDVGCAFSPFCKRFHVLFGPTSCVGVLS